MPDWKITIDIDDEDRDVAEAFAQGVANLTGRYVDLLRKDHGDLVHGQTFRPGGRDE